MPQELRYKAPEDREEVHRGGKRTVHWSPSPGWLYGHWRQSYARERGKRRREVVAYFAEGFRVEEAVAKRILRDDTPHRIEPDGTFVMTVPD
jgi:hypothetical protein